MKKQYLPFACLPFLDLDIPYSVKLGPVHFQPSQTIGGATVLIYSQVRDDQKSEILMDALHLFYFAVHYKSLYVSSQHPDFEPFTNILRWPIRENLKKLEIMTDHEETVYHLTSIDHSLCESFGRCLQLAYFEKDEEARRIIRAIRYFIHCFYDRFKVPFAPLIFEVEDTLFLTTAFEVLFNLNSDQPEMELKNRLRSLFHLKFSSPVEVMWKWVEGLYNLRDRVIHHGDLPHEPFIASESFDFPYLTLAIKIFLYAVLNKLSQAHMLKEEEVISLLWSETALIHKIATLSMQVRGKHLSFQQQEDLKELSALYFYLIERYYFKKPRNSTIHFRPSLSVQKEVQAILNYIDDPFEEEGISYPLSSLFPINFSAYLMKRAA